MGDVFKKIFVRDSHSPLGNFQRIFSARPCNKRVMDTLGGFRASSNILPLPGFVEESQGRNAGRCSRVGDCLPHCSASISPNNEPLGGHYPKTRVRPTVRPQHPPNPENLAHRRRGARPTGQLSHEPWAAAAAAADDLSPSPARAPCSPLVCSIKAFCWRAQAPRLAIVRLASP